MAKPKYGFPQKGPTLKWPCFLIILRSVGKLSFVRQICTQLLSFSSLLPSTFPWRNKVLGPLKPVFFHPASSLRVQAVIQRAGAQLAPGLEVPAGNLQFIQQSWRQAHEDHRHAEPSALMLQQRRLNYSRTTSITLCRRKVRLLCRLPKRLMSSGHTLAVG